MKPLFREPENPAGRPLSRPRNRNGAMASGPLDPEPLRQARTIAGAIPPAFVPSPESERRRGFRTPRPGAASTGPDHRRGHPARREGLEISTVPEANRPPRPMRTGHYFRCRSALSYRSIKASASQYTDSVLMRPASSTS